MNNGLFKINVMTVHHNLDKNNDCSSAYMVDSSCLCYDRLGHVNFNSLQKLMNLELLPNHEIDPHYKYKICVEAKLAKTLFHSVKRNTKPLDLIHSDLCDLKSI